jgi:hypothetical protein
MNDSDPRLSYDHALRDAPLPDDFVEFLAIDLELPRERAQHALVELMRHYRSRKQHSGEAWRESPPQPLG